MPRDDQPSEQSAAGPLYLTKKELMARTGLSGATLHRYKRSGKISYYQPGGRGARVLFPRDAIEAAARQSHLDELATVGERDQTGRAGQSPRPAQREEKLPGPRPRWQTRQDGDKE